jgi:hypothetical protein
MSAAVYNAACQELLDLSSGFRQNMALVHGLPLPTRNVIKEQTAAAPQAAETPGGSVPEKIPAQAGLSAVAKSGLAAAALGMTGLLGLAIGYTGYQAVQQDNRKQQITAPSGDLLKELKRQGYNLPPKQ